jgi:hypothetical protein
MTFNNAAVSGMLNTTGSRSPRLARAVRDSPSTLRPSTSQHRSRIAHSAWFCVLAETACRIAK